MSVRPMRQYPTPAYPDRRSAIADTTLLDRHQPASWRERPTLLALTGLLMSASSSAMTAELPTRDAPVQGGAQASDRPAVVAPLFLHGKGRGATGCVVVSPPVFLSEQDALSVIREELAKVGVQLGDGQVWDGTSIRPRKWKPMDDKGTSSRWVHLYSTPSILVERSGHRKAEPQPIQVDAVDTARSIAVEFVAEKDDETYGVPDLGSTAREYDLIEAARHLTRTVAMQKKGGVKFAAFYDPLVHFTGTWPEYEVDGKKPTQEEWQARLREAYAPDLARAKGLLRLQVLDFIAWLKAQGAI